MMLEDDRLFQPGMRLRLGDKTCERDVEIEFFRRQHGRCILKVREIDSIDEAERSVGSELRIAKADLPPAVDGGFYSFQLRGCDVFSHGDHLGTVTGIMDIGGADILEVDLNGVETLIPFAQSYLKTVDLEKRRIEVELPEGLRELNR